jgi:hypothetical protein
MNRERLYKIVFKTFQSFKSFNPLLDPPPRGAGDKEEGDYR